MARLRPRVYLLDDHDGVRRVVAELLEATGEFRVVGQGGSLADGIRHLLDERLEADVAVLDLRLGDGDGLDLCRQVRTRRRELAVLVLTAQADAATAAAARSAGARAVVQKQLRGDDLLTALRAATAR